MTSFRFLFLILLPLNKSGEVQLTEIADHGAMIQFEPAGVVNARAVLVKPVVPGGLMPPVMVICESVTEAR